MQVALDEGAVVYRCVVDAARGGGDDGGGGGVQMQCGLTESFSRIGVGSGMGGVLLLALPADAGGVGLLQAVGVVDQRLGIVRGDAVGGGALGQGLRFGEFTQRFAAVHLGAGGGLTDACAGAGGDEQPEACAQDRPAVGFKFEAGTAPCATGAGVGVLMDDVTGVELAVLVTGFKLGVQLGAVVVKQHTGVVAAIHAAAMDAADGAAVVGGAIFSRTERRQVCTPSGAIQTG